MKADRPTAPLNGANRAGHRTHSRDAVPSPRRQLAKARADEALARGHVDVLGRREQALLRAIEAEIMPLRPAPERSDAFRVVVRRLSRQKRTADRGPDLGR